MLIIYMILCSNLLETHGTVYKERSITYNEIGVILQKSGVTAIDTTHSILDIFVKLETPERCDTNNNTVSFNTDIDNEITKQLEMFKSLTNIQTALVSRHKRQLAILGASLLGAAFSTIGSLLIRHKSNDVKNEFHAYAQVQNAFNKKIIRFDNNIVKVLKQTENRLQEIDCQNREGLATLKFIIKIKSMFAMLKKGMLCSDITTEMLEMSDVRYILNQHPELNTTLYSIESLSYFYQTSQICLANIMFLEGNALTIHYLITVPFLTAKNTFPSYRVAQTGFKSKNNCYFLNLPAKVIKVGNTYKSIDNLMCQAEGSPIPICSAEPAEHMDPITCLSNITTCTFQRLPNCQDKFIYDKSGLLIKHSEPIQVLTKQKLIKVIEPTQNEISFAK